MANHKSALKRIRSSARRRMRNRVYTSLTRTEVKKARLALEGNNVNVNSAIEQVRAAVAQLDKAASKGIIHKNNAARKKSRLMSKLAKLQTAKAS